MLLHLPHRHHALVAQREHHQVDEDRQQDDRPAVVADVAVDPLQRAQQRHHQPGEHAEVDRAHQIAVDRGEHVEVLRAEEITRGAAGACVEPDRPRRRSSAPVFDPRPAPAIGRYSTCDALPARQRPRSGSSDRRRRRSPNMPSSFGLFWMFEVLTRVDRSRRGRRSAAPAGCSCRCARRCRCRAPAPTAPSAFSGVPPCVTVALKLTT